ncbi:rhodanese-like domain-containing protein [Geotalea toluenoxydans]|uniref:rhodanese-like domain-containing protein n=1 Tax=Geotalea toluenoxydans TaxID=421624 RepID=UPI0006D1D698|nr:rhodanese-like domain-containing protein [Geotalea toluenoxydans]
MWGRINKKKFVTLTALLGIGGAAMPSAAVVSAETPAAPARPVMGKICMNCHKPEGNNVIRGYLDGVSFKAKMLQVKLDDRVEIFNFDKNTIQVVNEQRKTGSGELLQNNLIRKGHEIRVEFSQTNGAKTAVKLTAKPPVELPAEMLISTSELEKLVRLGPEKGGYFLYDSRPAQRFQEGAIPGAVNLPFPAFDKMAEKLLPADKKALLIFYCSGPVCNMSPGSAAKAKKLGYGNIKVYKDGMPGWTEKHYAVLTPQSLKEAWLDKDMSHVLLDVRSTGTNRFINGAISFPAGQAKRLVKGLDLKLKKAPLILYDAGKDREAVTVARALIKAGYSNVKVLTGGFKGWESAGFPTETGKRSAKIVYIPKLKPGEVALDLFKQYAAVLPDGFAIVDVRLPAEVSVGKLKNAIAIPLMELRDRQAELPRDKTIILHCNTGTQAEIAYNMLKDLGYMNVRYFNGKVTFEKGGSYSITKD